MIKVIDNIISKKEQKKLIDLMITNSFRNNFNWFFQPDVTIKTNKLQRRPGFSHVFIQEKNVPNSDYLNYVMPIIDNTKDKLKISVKDVLQVRSFLQLPLDKNFIGKNIDTPHIDLQTPHTVFLYYLCDSDGDTVIYDYKSKNKKDIPYFENIKNLKRIKPKQGRVVVFDGLYWHTAEQPTKDVRCIINCNISTNGT